MKLYRLITGKDDSKFCMRISTLLNKGWKLHGAPSLSHDGNSIIAGQALTKKIKNKKFTDKINLDSY